MISILEEEKGGREEVREEGRGVESTTNKRNKIRREQGTPQQ